MITVANIALIHWLQSNYSYRKYHVFHIAALYWRMSSVIWLKGHIASDSPWMTHLFQHIHLGSLHLMFWKKSLKITLRCVFIGIFHVCSIFSSRLTCRMCTYKYVFSCSQDVCRLRSEDRLAEPASRVSVVMNSVTKYFWIVQNASALKYLMDCGEIWRFVFNAEYCQVDWISFRMSLFLRICHNIKNLHGLICTRKSICD
jgi:hypothetical protein